MDFGLNASDYNLSRMPEEKIGFSYIIDDEVRSEKETKIILLKISDLLNIYPSCKFVRVAGNCLISGINKRVYDNYSEFVDVLPNGDKFFIKDIGLNDVPHNHACMVGMIRPYVAPKPDGSNYNVYICTSYVLQQQNYNDEYALCLVDQIIPAWDRLSGHFREHGYPYAVKNNKGRDWNHSCPHCFYKFNNETLDTITSKVEDSDFA